VALRYVTRRSFPLLRYDPDGVTPLEHYCSQADAAAKLGLRPAQMAASLDDPQVT